MTREEVAKLISDNTDKIIELMRETHQVAEDNGFEFVLYPIYDEIDGWSESPDVYEDVWEPSDE